MQRDAHQPGSGPAGAGNTVIPDHELIRCIGRGSYGEVWLARNLMGVYRAVKIIDRGSFDSSRPYERELAGIRRYEPVSRSHDGLVDVLHIGTDHQKDRFYYIMELADDLQGDRPLDPDQYVPRTLAGLIARQGRLPAEQALRVGLALSNALVHLHQHGLVHRDVKPSNIVFIHGQPKLADIGLVAPLEEARSYVGTEGFIPPEGPGSVQADIYSLGKVLYEISTGKDRHDYPELPTLLDQAPDLELLLELNEVILHACRNDTRERYASAKDMHADLVVVFNGKSVRRLRLLEQKLGRLKRAAGPVALGALFLGLFGYHVHREQSLERESRQREVGSKMGQALAEVASGDLLEALPPLADALRLDARNREREHRVRVSAVIEQCPKLVRMWFLDGRANDIEFDPSGHRVVITRDDGAARVHDVASGRPLSPPFGSGPGLRRASFDPTGGYVMAVSEFGRATIHHAVTGKELCGIEAGAFIHNAVYSPDGLKVVLACANGMIQIWSVEQLEHPRLLREFAGGHGPVWYAAFSPDMRLLVTGGQDNTARLWHASDGRPAGPPLVHENWVKWAAFSPDSERIVTAVASAGSPSRAVVWEVSTGRRIYPELFHAGSVSSVGYSPDGLMICSSDLDGNVRLWDALTQLPQPLNATINHRSPVHRAAIAGDGRRIATACQDGSVRVWDLAGLRVVPQTREGTTGPGAAGRILAVQDRIRVWDDLWSSSPAFEFAPDLVVDHVQLNASGRVAILAGKHPRDPEAVHFEAWDLPNRNRLAGSVPGPANPNPIHCSATGEVLAIRTPEEVKVFSRSGVLIRRFPLVPAGDVLFSADDQRIALVVGDTVHVHELSSGAAVCQPLRHAFPVTVAAFDHGGRWLAASSADQIVNSCEIVVWSLATGAPAGPPLVHQDGVLGLEFSPDGRRLASASEDKTAVIWSPPTGEPLVSVRHEGQVYAARFSPDGHWLATLGSDRTTRLWDGRTGEPLTPPLQHAERVRSLSFSRDGRNLVTSDGRSQVSIWPVPVDPRPLADIADLAQLLTSASRRPPGTGNREAMRGLQSIWERLLLRYPSDFTAGLDEQVDWHLERARYGLTEKRWQAAAFHLRVLGGLKPEDARLAVWLNDAESRIKEAAGQ